MRSLRIVCGIAVLLSALHFIHLLHHAFAMNMPHGAGFWALFLLAIVIDLFCFIGGYLLLKPSA
jgi:hypothetical protein